MKLTVTSYEIHFLGSQINFSLRAILILLKKKSCQGKIEENLIHEIDKEYENI
jgi:hypothetical protein